MTGFRTSRAFDVVFIVIMIAVVWWASANRVAIGDTVFFWNHQASDRATEMSMAAGLSDEGRRLFYRSDPVFAPQGDIIKECDIERLGCLSSKGQAFILDDPEKPAQTAVTAAHEMLHLAYLRLSEDKKAELAPLLDEGIAQNALDIESELESAKTDADRRDEAHSLLGTEYPNLPAGLETYYQTYFADRSKVIKAASED